jgi:hypothetical protein
VPPPGVALKDAMVFIGEAGPIVAYSDSGTTVVRRIFRGQMVHKSDPEVSKNPTMFRAAQPAISDGELEPALSETLVVVASPAQVIGDSGRQYTREMAD